MRYCLLALLALLLLAACGDTAAPTPIRDVPALQTEAAALQAVATARAALIPATMPPVESTRSALQFAYTLTFIGVRPDDPVPTRTARAATQVALAATLTA